MSTKIFLIPRLKSSQLASTSDGPGLNLFIRKLTNRWRIKEFLARIAAVSTFALLCLSVAHAQTPPTTTTSTTGWTPLAQQPGAPAGSYSLSGFDNVNLYNGHLNFHLPLLTIGGRGRAGYTMMLPIEQHWRPETVAVPTCNQSGCTYYESDYRYIANPVWWTGLLPRYGPGVLQGRHAGSGSASAEGCSVSPYYFTLTRLTFSAPDGTEYELIDAQTGGQPLQGGGSSCYGGQSRGKVFITRDGSAATFISDADIYDEKQPQAPPNNVISPSGYLMLRDGTRYHIVNGQTEWILDANGNKTTFTNTAGGLDIYDSLNRHVSVVYGSPTVITFKGTGGVDRTIKVYQDQLHAALRKHPDGSTEYSIQTFTQLFPSLQNVQQGTFDIPVTTAVELPDGRQYQFRYDSYANLAQVILPTGGRMEYDWTTGSYQFGDHVKGIYSRVLQRRTAVNSTTTTYETKSTYSAAVTYDGTQHYTTVTVDTLDPNNSNALLARSKHYFNGEWLPSLYGSATDYAAWKDGREYQTEDYAANGTTVLRRVNNNWQQRAAISWWTGSANDSPGNDPRMVESTTILVDTNQASKRSAINPSDGTVGFDQYNNQTDVWEYDFGTGAPGALVRHSHTNFLTSGYDTLNPVWNNPNLSTTYHLRSLPTQTSVYDANNNEKARTSFEYDNYTLDGSDCSHSFHCSLQPRSNISGLDSSFTPSFISRGNVTATSKYVLPTGTPITSYSQYDIAGNLIKVIDPRSTTGNIIATTIGYDDNFGGPDGSLGERYTFSELGSQQTFAFPTLVTNALGQSSFTQFDYYLGQAINQQDFNGIIVAGYHSDLLDRLTQIKRAYGTSVENQTSFEYDDATRIITTKADLNTNGDNALTSKLVYDGLGRTIESRQYEGATNYIAAQTQYDGAGRAYRTSNPYRSGDPLLWTTSAFDALGRMTSVTTPDSAVVTTSYSGNIVTVTDQAGKARKSVTDGLGRLVQVYEDPSGLNYLTSYGYDTLDDLTSVSQGTQTRTFTYDSLKRLKSATNPESGTICYGTVVSSQCQADGYDANGNLIYKTDARGVRSTYGYDALNRNISITYTNDPAGTPSVTRIYDGATYGIGRIWKTETAGTSGSRTTINSYDALGRPLSQDQQFSTSGIFGPAFTVQRTYDRAGHVKTQNHPSGHSVTYNYDAAGRLADKDSQNLAFTGNLGDGTLRTYSSEIVYSPLGGMTNEKFGTETALYNKTIYNSRGQAAEIRVGTYHPTDSTWWNRGAIINHYSDSCWGSCGGSNSTTQMTDNNGNLKKQEVYIPNSDFPNTQQISSSTTWWQQYNYDALNRLDWVREISSNGAEIWKQDFTYDPYGNRTIDQTNTWGPATGPAINKKNFTVDTANNRLGVPAGQSGTMSYDNAGNLTTDTYSGLGVTRAYDAENRMTSETQANSVLAGSYTYNADGQRVRRTVGGQPSAVTTWQVYGMEGELLAEYAANTAAGSPQKEYGYRNGQLLITAAAPAGSGGINVALAANGAVASASSSYPSSANEDDSPATANNGDRTGKVGSIPSVWNDAAPANSFPDWLQVDFNGSQSIGEIDVFTIQDNWQNPSEPTESMSFSSYGLTSYEVQYWDGSAWITVPNGSVTGNNKVWRKFTFSPIATNKIKVLTHASGDGYSRINELEAWTASSESSSAQIQWLVTDQLGTPRMVFDKTGSLAATKRHDYLPFGEEIFADTGGRTTGGYPASSNSSDGVRQKFTLKERDIETGLDYFLARYYSSVQGRFTSPDEFTGGPDELYTFAEDASNNPTFYASLENPQSLNKYQYAYNNPLRYTDADGHCPVCAELEELAASPAGQWVEGNLDKVVTGVGAAATTVIVLASGAGKAILDHGGQSAMRADMEDLRITHQQQKSTSDAGNKSDSKPKDKSQDFTPADKRKIDSKTSGNCADCGRETESIQNKRGVPTPANQRQRHHDPPKSQGGTRDSEKNVLLCPGCHKERHRQIREIQADRKRQQ